MNQPEERKPKPDDPGEDAEPAPLPAKPKRQHAIDVYATYDIKKHQARIGLSLTIGRKPKNKR